MKKVKPIASIIICIAVILSCTVSVFADNSVPQNFAAGNEIILNNNLLLKTDGENSGGSVNLSENNSAVWSFTAGADTECNIEITYKPTDNNVTDIETEIKLNGEIPYKAFESYTLQRLWENDSTEMNGKEYMKDSSGNELSPSQIQKNESSSVVLSDISGAEITPFPFRLKKGVNTLEIISKRNSFLIEKIRIFTAEKIPSYAEYLNIYKNAACYNGETLIIEGESASTKSSSVLAPTQDKSSPETSPSSPEYSLVNTIGASSFNQPGQWIEWTVNTAEEGYYGLGIKYRQNEISGMFTTRTLYVNGKIPFSEANYLEFKYNSKWQISHFADSDGREYKIYLNKGENKIRLSVSMGRAAAFYEQGKASVEALNKAYRQIIMLTGTSPDSLRNYRVDVNCPEAMGIIKEQIKQLGIISSGIADISEKKGDINTSIDNLKLQLESFAKKPMTIPSRIDSFRSNITAFADAVYSLSKQPLEIDYLMLSSVKNREMVNETVKTGFFKWLVFEARAYIASFASEYSSSSVQNKKSITVWTTSGRDQATVLKRLIDTKYTPDSDISINLKIVENATGVSTLLLSTVSGLGPDVAVGIVNSEVVNYALRNMAVDISKCKDFSTVKERFFESAMVPYAYEGGYYALPITQSFAMMFYRTDLLSELNIEIPNTWDELYIAMGKLQKNNMTVGIPSDLNYLASQIYQNGAELYTADSKKSLFDSAVSMKAFSKWCNLYTSYNLPIDYDAANRFRTGEMPLIIADYAFYNTVSVLAPEITGLWKMALIPGTKIQNNELNRTVSASGTSAMILSTTKSPDDAMCS